MFFLRIMIMYRWMVILTLLMVMLMKETLMCNKAGSMNSMVLLNMFIWMRD